MSAPVDGAIVSGFGCGSGAHWGPMTVKFRVTNFRVQQDQTKSGLNLGGIGGQIGGGRFGAGQSGFDKKEQRITPMNYLSLAQKD